MKLLSSSTTRKALCALALLGTFALPLATAHAATIGSIISYQGQLTDSTGKPVPDGQTALTFNIYQNGSIVSYQSMNVATVGGVFNTFLTVGNVVFDPSKTYELGIKAPNQNEVKHSIAAVPVALAAKRADSAATAAGVSVPLTLSSKQTGAILTVENTGTGPAISATGPISATNTISAAGDINTDAGYNIGNERILGITLGGDGTIALGRRAGEMNTGDSNLFAGVNAGRANTTAGANTFIGSSAGIVNTTGSSNTFIGQGAGFSQVTGDNNIAIGSYAGQNPKGGSNNIHIGNPGPDVDLDADNDTIRLGTVQTKAFIAGIFGASVPGEPVLVGSDGQLGTVNASSRLYKQDVHPIGHQSDWLLKLRPVTFRYTSQFLKSTQPSALQHGLIAEEVAKVAPQMVQFDSKGQPLGVKYGDLPILLLNVVQQQQRTIEELQARLGKLEASAKSR